MQGRIIIKTISFSFSIFYFTTFLIAHFFTFLQQFTAANLKVAGNSAHIFTTLLSPEERCPFNTGNRYLAFFWDQILCLLNAGVLWMEVSLRRGSTVFTIIKVLVKCYQPTSTLIVLDNTKNNPQTIIIIVYYQVCTLTTITYGRRQYT